MKMPATAIMTFALCVVFAVPKPASATDAKTYPGAMCRAARGTETEIGANGEIESPPMEPVAVVMCPIVRDSLSGNPGSRG